MSHTNGAPAPVLVAADPPKDADSGEDQVNVVPCTIHVKDVGAFLVEDVGAWVDVERGIFATGNWQYRDRFTSPDTIDVLIPHDSIRYIELHYDRLEA